MSKITAVLGPMSPLPGAIYSDSQGNLSTNPPCETVLMATNEQFREFAAKVVAAIEAHELAAKTEAAIHVHELDDIWTEAKRIIASIDKHNENT